MYIEIQPHFPISIYSGTDSGGKAVTFPSPNISPHPFDVRRKGVESSLKPKGLTNEIFVVVWYNGKSG